jgi:hypothetical protein
MTKEDRHSLIRSWDGGIGYKQANTDILPNFNIFAPKIAITPAFRQRCVQLKNT